MKKERSVRPKPRNARPLEKERTALVRDRIKRAALDGLSDVGIDVRVEDIARIAGVGRRTVFRYFPTRDDLLLAAFELAFQNYLHSIPPRDGQDVDTWLVNLVRTVTERNAGYGLGYWQWVLRNDTEGPFGAPLHARRKKRQKWSAEVAREAWKAAKGKGKPPTWLVHAFTLHLGPFATAGLHLDSQLEFDEVAKTTSKILRTLLEYALSTSGRRQSRRNQETGQ